MKGMVMNMDFKVMRATETWQQAGAYYVRIQAMARQYHITLREEFDEHDTPDTKYIVILDGDFPVATCRLYELPEEASEDTEGKVTGEAAEKDSEEGAKADGAVRAMMLGRIVVLPEYRKKGLGRLVVTEAEKWARELGCNKAVLDSRDVAVGFYEKLGYTADHSRIVHGWTFTCVHMEKSLEQA